MAFAGTSLFCGGRDADFCIGDRGKGRAGGREGKVQGFRGGGTKGEQPPPQGSRAIRPNAGCVRSQCPQTIPPNVCEGDLPLRPENAILPLLRRLFALSPTDLCIIHLSLPAAHSPFSGQTVKKSAEYWPHKGEKI